MQSVNVCALATSGLERHALAVTLLSVVLTAREVERVCIDDIDIPLMDGALARARSSLDATEFANAEEEGRRLDEAGALDLLQSSVR
jgi:hypothetical protein